MASSNKGLPGYKASSKINKALIKFVSDNRVLIICIIAIAFVFIGSKREIANAKQTHNTEIEKLIIGNKKSIDSLNEDYIKQLTVVLSWAVRRHLLHDNLEEIDLMFTSFIKENNVAKIQLINPKNATVLISTDKNEQGENVDNPFILNIRTVEVLKPSDNHTDIVVAPIIGLNQKEGILVVHYNLKT